MKSPSASADNSPEWESYVGKAILRFGDIEVVSIRLLARRIEKSERSISRKRFADRATKLIELLAAQTALSKPEANLLSGFRRAAELARTRNLIAHNPLMMDIYVNSDETEMYADHSIRSARSHEESLDLAAIKEFAGEVEDLSSDIWLNYCQAVGSSNDLWRIVDSDGFPSVT